MLWPDEIFFLILHTMVFFAILYESYWKFAYLKELHPLRSFVITFFVDSLCHNFVYHVKKCCGIDEISVILFYMIFYFRCHSQAAYMNIIGLCSRIAVVISSNSNFELTIQILPNSLNWYWKIHPNIVSFWIQKHMHKFSVLLMNSLIIYLLLSIRIRFMWIH